MSRLIVSGKSRTEIDISKYFGDYEFPVVTKSLFHDEGKLVPKKKNILFERSQKICLYPEVNFTILIEENKSIIIFDATAVVNRTDIQIQKGIIRTCRDFANLFSKIILKES